MLREIFISSLEDITDLKKQTIRAFFFSLVTDREKNQEEISLVTGRTNPEYFCHCICVCARMYVCVMEGVLLLRAENQREEKTIQAILSILSLGGSQRPVSRQRCAAFS